MNWHFIASGMLAAIGLLVHVALGNRDTLGPTLQASYDPVAKRTMHGAWHAVTATLLWTTGLLLAAGLGVFQTDSEADLVARLVAVLYLAFTAVFAWVAVISRLPKAFIKLPQWVFFIPIAGLALWGST